MRILSLIAAVVLLGCGAAHAQSVMTVPGMGATSPLGVLGSSASSGSNSATGIPLGATEIDPGGLSPAPMSNCNTSGSSNSAMSSGMTGSSGSGITGSIFDGGGFGSTMTSACVSTSASASSATSSGTASPLSPTTTNSNF